MRTQWPMLCGKCNQPLTNTHLLGGCKYISKLQTYRHSSTFKLLRDLLERHNGGGWPIISMDLGSKPTKDFKAQTIIETTTPQEGHYLQALQARQDGLQDEKTTPQLSTIIPITLLPKHKRPKHIKPDIIRGIGYRKKSHG